jgi:hypothetical protein
MSSQFVWLRKRNIYIMSFQGMGPEFWSHFRLGRKERKPQTRSKETQQARPKRTHRRRRHGRRVKEPMKNQSLPREEDTWRTNSPDREAYVKQLKLRSHSPKEGSPHRLRASVCSAEIERAKRSDSDRAKQKSSEASRERGKLVDRERSEPTAIERNRDLAERAESEGSETTATTRC